MAGSLTCKIIDSNGKDAGSIELSANVFDVPLSKSLVHSTVVWQRNKGRAGTHSALTKAEVSGGGKKPWKQKGTGRARAGSNTSPLWVGGGVTHGPKPRDYTSRLSKRARRQALHEVLSEKRRADKLLILDKFPKTEGKTKQWVATLKKLGLTNAKVLIVEAVVNGEVAAAAGNITSVSVLPLSGINVYDVLKNEYLLTSKENVEILNGKQGAEKTAGKKVAGKKAAGKTAAKK